MCGAETTSPIIPFWATLPPATLFDTLFVGIVITEVVSFAVTEEVKVDTAGFVALLADDGVVGLETVIDVENVEVIGVDTFTVAAVIAFGEPFKLFALEFSFTDRLEKDESRDWQGDVEVFGTSTLIFALPGYS